MEKYSGKYIVVCGDCDCGAVMGSYDRNADVWHTLKRCPQCDYDDYEMISAAEYEAQCEERDGGFL